MAGLPGRSRRISAVVIAGALLAGSAFTGASAAADGNAVRRRPAAPASARPAPPPASAPEDALTRAWRRGRIDEADYTLNRALSLFHLGKVRARFGKDVERPDPHDATILLRDLAIRLTDLDRTERATAQALLARPSDPTGDPFGNRYLVPATSTCSEHLCFHWVELTDDAPDLTDDDGDGLPNWIESNIAVFEQVYTHEIGTMGFRAPKSDADSVADGGNGKLDIYISDLGADGLYGYCTSDDPNLSPVSDYRYFDASAYCGMDDDFASDQFGPVSGLAALQVTAAHEFFHAVQFAYDFYEDPWIMESTATWMEERVYDSIDDNRQYLASSPLSDPTVPLDSFIDFGAVDPNAGFQYGTWIFWEFLSTRLKRTSIVKEAWTRADGAQGGFDDYSLEATVNAVAAAGADFRTLFAEFAAVNRGPGSFYEEGAAYPAAPVDATHTLAGSSSPAAGSLTLDHLTSRLVSFTPSGTATDEKLELTVDGPDTTAGSKAMIIVKPSSGAWTRRNIPLAANGTGATTVAFDAATTSEVVLVLVNASPRYAACWTGVNYPSYSCYGGTPTDDDVSFAYSGRVSTGGEPSPEPTESPDPGDEIREHARGLSLVLRKHLVARGAIAVADGYTPCAAGVPIKVQRKASGRWKTVKSTITTTVGTFKVKLKDRPGRYRVKAPADYLEAAPNDLCKAAVSAAKRHRH